MWHKNVTAEVGSGTESHREQQLSVIFPNFYRNADGVKPLLEFSYTYLYFF